MKVGLRDKWYHSRAILKKLIYKNYSVSCILVFTLINRDGYRVCILVL